MAVSLATINVNGIAEAPKRVKVFHALLSSHFDIFFCKKLISPVSHKVRSGKGNGGYGRVVPGSNRSAGVAVLFHPQCAAKLADLRTDLSGRVVTVKVELEGKFFQLFNVYASNTHSDRKEFFDSLWRYSFFNLDSIVAVYFNCVLDVALDKWGGDDRFGNKAVSLLHLFTNSLSLEDFYRIFNLSRHLFMWFNGPHSVGCRLDRFYTPRAWRSRVSAHTSSSFAY